ncbi:outer membrane protein assembly factor BamB family protein [Auraticoccus monumenti]|uniref:PQQ-like domain-containing protein n=1 Tax=Auraticoccus monumenti TaxID=675864 RepID=A0A1G6ZEA7_9ACTN|nr:PQQ-binding-like beta-propeller repeat protein [Auraticoccus monumenti]SDE00633.1 PQQ-like domain-containing protein [Auraticoccus monumenti]
MVTALVLGLLSAAAMVYPDPSPDHAASAMVPEDGHSAALGSATGGLMTVETARQPGAQALQSGPEEFLDVFSVDETAVERSWVRVTEHRRDGTAGSVTHTLRSLEESGLHEWVRRDGSSAVALTPSALVLPADLRAGQRWSSSGVVHDVLRDRASVGDYVLDASAAASGVGPHCLDVSSSFRVEGSDAYDTVLTWCRGEGVVAQQLPGESWHPLEGTVAEHAGLEPVDTVSPPVSWSPEGWTAQRRPFLRFDTPSPLVVPRAPELPTDSGPVLTPTSGGDVLALEPDGDGFGWRWLAHPGGSVTTTAAFGEVVVAGTTRRQLVAYDRDGFRRWTLDLDDVVVRDLVRADDRTLLTADQSGTVTAVDIATGAVRWQASVGADLKGSLSRCGDVAVVADSAPSVTAFDLGDGSRRWSVRPPEQVLEVACSDDTVVLVDSEFDRHALAVADGSTRWRRPGLDGPEQLQVVDDLVVLRTDDEVVGLSVVDGMPRWREPGTSDGIVAVDGFVTVAKDDELVVLDQSGVPVTTVPGLPEAQENYLHVATGASGMWFLGTDGVPTWVGP